MIVLDTSVLIDHLRGHDEARRVVDTALADHGAVVGSVLTRTEILTGVRPGAESATRRLLASIDWAPVDETIADAAGALARQWHRQFPGIDTVDYVIAATADAHGVAPTTRNVKHFPMFPGLRPPY